MAISATWIRYLGLLCSGFQRPQSSEGEAELSQKHGQRFGKHEYASKNGDSCKSRRQ